MNIRADPAFAVMPMSSLQVLRTHQTLLCRASPGKGASIGIEYGRSLSSALIRLNDLLAF